MSKITKYFLLPLSFLFAGCATLLPVEQRRVEIVKETKTKKSIAYKKALTHLAKTMGNAKKATQIADESEAHIVTPMIISCAELTPSFDPFTYDLQASVEFQAKDNKVRFVFEDLVTLSSLDASIVQNGAQITTPAHVEKAKVCLNRMVVEPLLAAIGDSKKVDW